MADRNTIFYENIPDGMPRMHHPITAKVFRFIYHLMGWRFLGEVPDINKAVVILAPHTSNWDFFIACVVKFSLRLKASYIMKEEAFFWPFKNWLLGIGGIPIDRSQPARIVTQVTRAFEKEERVWVVITPEGTRKKVNKYKTGFVRIAQTAGVPIIVVGFDYGKKAIVFSKVVYPGPDYDAEADALYHYCRDNFVARHPECQ